MLFCVFNVPCHTLSPPSKCVSPRTKGTHLSTVIAMFFEKIKRVHRNIGVQKDSETLLLKTVPIFCGLA